MFAILCTLCALQAPTAPPPVAFVDVSVLPMDTNRVLERQTVVVRGGRITELGPVAKVMVPAGATLVDGRGKFLMPGFTEMHGHLPNPGAQNAIPGIVETVLRVNDSRKRAMADRIAAACGGAVAGKTLAVATIGRPRESLVAETELERTGP